MNIPETNIKEPYEPPEVVDIKPVTTCQLVGMSEDPDENPDEY